MNDIESTLLATIPSELFIGGQWVDASDGSQFVVEDPATGQQLAKIANASPTDGIRALDSASRAADGWAATAPRVRAEILRRAWELLMERKHDFALLITLEMGKPLVEAESEVAYGGEFLRWFGEEAVRISGRYGRNPEGSGQIIVSHRPVGPSFLITPWNFPLAMATRKIAPALAAGCTVVVKPAELTPLTTLFFAKLLIEAGVPAGVVNVIPTSRSSEVSAPIIADPRLRKLSFTGSTEVGRKLLQQAAGGILRTSAALKGALIAKFRNIGQACTAANRFIVHESVVDEFARRLAEATRGLRMGRGTEAGIDIGPLISERAVANTASLVEDAVGRGGRVLTGGAAVDGAGTFFAPTVITGLDTSARMMREEIFAPVVGIMSFHDEAEAIRLANSTEYGLVGYVWTRDLARVQRLIESIETGMMGINTGIVSNAAAPFGGVKQSGLGREGGAEGLREYLETKYSVIPS
jgi:succinate-semialdehyde dehydrogenase/glutarate-semialdehyde dehydrogenase